MKLKHRNEEIIKRRKIFLDLPLFYTWVYSYIVKSMNQTTKDFVLTTEKEALMCNMHNVITDFTW